MLVLVFHMILSLKHTIRLQFVMKKTCVFCEVVRELFLGMKTQTHVALNFFFFLVSVTSLMMAIYVLAETFGRFLWEKKYYFETENFVFLIKQNFGIIIIIIVSKFRIKFSKLCLNPAVQWTEHLTSPSPRSVATCKDTGNGLFILLNACLKLLGTLWRHVNLRGSP